MHLKHKKIGGEWKIVSQQAVSEDEDEDPPKAKLQRPRQGTGTTTMSMLNFDDVDDGGADDELQDFEKEINDN